VGIREEGKLVKMQTEHGETFIMKTEGQDTTSGYSTVDSRTQEKVSKWIQLLHKHLAHLHALDIKDAQQQRDPGIKPLAGMTMSKLTDKYTIKRNKIRNQIILLRGQTEGGVVFFLDKVEETINACDNLLVGTDKSNDFDHFAK